MTAPAQTQTTQSYQAEQVALAVAAAMAAGQAASLAGYSLANFTVWSRLIRLVYDVVSRQRYKSAFSARDFFDRQRRAKTGLPQLDVPLVGYDINRFAKAMRPTYDLVVKQLAQAKELEKQGLPVPPPKVDTTIRLFVSREVLQAGREQTWDMVDAHNAEIQNLDKEPVILDYKGRPVNYVDQRTIGWARVPTGDETCAWCMMLCSRGGIFPGEKAATAFYSSEEKALRRASDGEAFHTGCDCAAIAVFDRDTWDDKPIADAAAALWSKALDGFEYDENKKYRVNFGKKNYEFKSGIPKWDASQRYAMSRIRQYYDGKIDLGLTPDQRRLLNI